MEGTRDHPHGVYITVRTNGEVIAGVSGVEKKLSCQGFRTSRLVVCKRPTDEGPSGPRFSLVGCSPHSSHRNCLADPTFGRSLFFLGWLNARRVSVHRPRGNNIYFNISTSARRSVIMGWLALDAFGHSAGGFPENTSGYI